MADIVYPTYYSLHTKTSFFEVTQYFAAQKIKIIMGTYDKKTQIEVFFTVQEARKMARDIKNGIVKNNLLNIEEVAKKQGTKPEYANLYATTSKGTKGRYRYLAVRKGTRTHFTLVGLSGPGKEDENGLMKIAGAPDQQVFIPVQGSLLDLADALLDAAHDCNIYTMVKWMADTGVLENAGKQRK